MILAWASPFNDLTEKKRYNSFYTIPWPSWKTMEYVEENSGF